MVALCNLVPGFVPLFHERASTVANQDLSTSPLLLNPRQAAAMLSVSTRTLWALTDRREIPAVRVGTQWRYSRQALAHWVEEQGRLHLQNGGASE